jgi:hypothetical protein
MAVQFRDAAVGKSDDTHTTQKNPLGYIARGTDGSEWVYLSGVASCVAGSAVTYGVAGAAVLSVTGARGPVAIAGAATTAALFGWFCRSTSVGVSADFNGAAVLGAKLYSAGTGKVDDAVVAGDQITGAVVGATVSGSGQGTVILDRAFMNGTG